MRPLGQSEAEFTSKDRDNGHPRSSFAIGALNALP